MNVIDRRLNPKGKSLGNRQRFLKRAKEQVRKAVSSSSAKRAVSDIESGDKISIPIDGIREPTFRHSQTGGHREHILPGNKEYVEGDTIPRPPSGGGGRGSEGSPDGDGEDDFRFVLSQEEFLDLFLEDLELPDLTKKKVKQAASFSLTRAGYSTTGSPANLNVVRTVRNSLQRRIALRRPSAMELEALAAEIERLEQGGEQADRLAALREELERLERRRQVVPFIDPIDVRYNRFDVVPKPITQAVMFCLMDVSGSMTEHMKDLAKRFFMLLYVFLTRSYKHVDIVFIRHTHRASEVDEQTFFYSRESGGTVVSTALDEMRRVIRERYPVEDWNIYAAQASDGDNVQSDNRRAADMLENMILPMCQYFAYIEVGSDRGHPNLSYESALWMAYRGVSEKVGLPAMRKVSKKADIYPVFRELFSRERTAA